YLFYEKLTHAQHPQTINSSVIEEGQEIIMSGVAVFLMIAEDIIEPYNQQDIHMLHDYPSSSTIHQRFYLRSGKCNYKCRKKNKEGDGIATFIDIRCFLPVHINPYPGLQTIGYRLCLKACYFRQIHRTCGHCTAPCIRTIVCMIRR